MSQKYLHTILFHFFRLELEEKELERLSSKLTEEESVDLSLQSNSFWVFCEYIYQKTRYISKEDIYLLFEVFHLWIKVDRLCDDVILKTYSEFEHVKSKRKRLQSHYEKLNDKPEVSNEQKEPPVEDRDEYQEVGNAEEIVCSDVSTDLQLDRRVSEEKDELPQNNFNQRPLTSSSSSESPQKTENVSSPKQNVGSHYADPQEEPGDPSYEQNSEEPLGAGPQNSELSCNYDENNEAENDQPEKAGDEKDGTRDKIEQNPSIRSKDSRLSSINSYDSFRTKAKKIDKLFADIIGDDNSDGNYVEPDFEDRGLENVSDQNQNEIVAAEEGYRQIGGAEIEGETNALYVDATVGPRQSYKKKGTLKKGKFALNFLSKNF